MNIAIAVWRVLAYPLAVPEGMRGTDNGTTEGGRDKRPCAHGHYGVIVVGLFAVIAGAAWALHAARALISNDLAVATSPERGATA